MRPSKGALYFGAGDAEDVARKSLHSSAGDEDVQQVESFCAEAHALEVSILEICLQSTQIQLKFGMESNKEVIQT